MPSYIRTKPNSKTPQLPAGYRWVYRLKETAYDSNTELLEVSIRHKMTLRDFLMNAPPLITVCIKLDAMQSDTEMEEEITELEHAALGKLLTVT